MIVTIPSNEIRAKTLINAAGAWASRISQMAGGMALPLATHQRHLSWSAAPILLRVLGLGGWTDLYT